MNPFIGQIVMFGGNFAPRGWAFCDGQLLSIASNSALFSLIGTIYGGDGRTTFGLPDLRGRVALHEGSGPGLTSRRIGQESGVENTTLSSLNLPPHNHSASGTITLGTAANQPAATNNFLPVTTGSNFFSDTQGNAALNAASLNVTTGNTGGNQPFNNMAPFLAVNYIIALVGIYPSRN